MKTRKISLLSVLTALSVSLEITKSILPGGFVIFSGVEPVTFLVVLGGCLLGPLYGAIQGILVNILYSFFLGVSVILPFTASGFGFIGFISGLVLKKLREEDVFLWGLSGLILTLFYDVYTNLVHALLFNVPLLFSLASGFILPPFIGVKHVVSNFLLFSLVYPYVLRHLKHLANQWNLSNSC